ncbi:hypothetical protein [Flagellimonas allohymeniacidonis]|uniref:Uncharacterized protein n=1 Tax=Flagellimonas allohymeniacidonis TaxID=2517819 RepID=A0A4Q8QDK6_9FLAO|nr:hypothetical protein [Allomuricauda hymeniacidonis]TAI47637.1 hypothetical protein EW142_13315 [Allomuricauda hymeniacidonis]
MNYKTIEFLLLQLEESFSKSRSNIYSEVKKEQHFRELYQLFKSIRDSEYRRLRGNELYVHFNILTYIFKGLEYLDNSTLNVIPYEIVSCLEKALSDWIRREDFIVVTSLSNRNLDFYFESGYSEEYFQGLNKYVSKFYGTTITHRLIRIGLPKVLARDYLSCVALYHELGHFVDNELNISKKLLLETYKTDNPRKSPSTFMYYSHRTEYFADLFAAQYINDASDSFLNYIAYDEPDSQTHPATAKRTKVVQEFLSNQYCMEKNDFNKVLKASGSPQLSLRHNSIDVSNSDFIDLVPQNLENDGQLHYIFKLGWDIWKESDDNFLKDFKSRQKHQIINNLIEKSISNYTISAQWKKLNDGTIQ